MYYFGFMDSFEKWKDLATPGLSFCRARLLKLSHGVPLCRGLGDSTGLTGTTSCTHGAGVAPAGISVLDLIVRERALQFLFELLSPSS